jgi:MoaA/NifB/PqqE/SkfB family radical SAM enzyme
MKRYFTRLWIIANPVILYRILRGFFRAIILRRNTLRTLTLLPTFDCQARCTMCSVAKFRKGKEGTLTLSDYESIAGQAAALGAITAAFCGGEPLLRKDLPEIVRIFKSHHFFVCLVTNGIALTPELARTLRAAGLDALYFGLESLDPDENDRLRGYPGQCRKVMEGLRICSEEGLASGFCTVFFPGDTRRYVRIAEYCETHGLRAHLPTLATVGAAKDMQAASEDQYRQIKNLLKEHRRLMVDWAFSYFLTPRCPSGKEKIAITAYGDVMGCSLNQISFGNVKEESLEAIWRRASRFSQFSKNSDRCLAAFDRHHIATYLEPVASRRESPVLYKDHPNITPQSEPELFP